jgi:elongation factor 1 alpha-like protein
MSRHRNVKQLVDEDYYDDDDDYYDDNYDDYDDGYTGGSTSMKVAPKKNKVNSSTLQNPSSKHHSGANKSSGAKKPGTVAALSTAKAKSSQPSTGGVSSASKVNGNSSKNTAAITAPSTSTATILPPPGFQPIFTNAPTQEEPKSRSLDRPAQSQNSTHTTEGPSSSATNSALPIPAVLMEQVSQQTRIPLTVVVLGHVDAGKSTISGHLLYGSDGNRGNHNKQHSRVSNSTTNRNANTNFAWLLDEDEQERAHGVTMDIATKRLVHNASSKFDIVLQDAPGHADYVPAMITGTASADAALLCVDATDLHTALGNGQLREHAYLARGLGVNQILVVLNKMDIVGWDQEATYLRMESMLVEFLTKQVGYPAARVRCIPLSGLSGTNLFPVDSIQSTDMDTKTLRSWYKGPTLIEALDNFQAPASQQLSKLLEKPLRIIVSDVIESSGSLSLRAKVVSGWVKQGETLVVLPVGDNAVISKLNSLHVSAPTPASAQESTPMQQQLRRQYCAAGELLDCVITGIDAQRISTGSLLVRSSGRPPMSARCRSKIFVMDNSGNGNQVPLIRGAQMIFHMHHLDVPCHVSALLRTLKPDGVTTLKERPRALTKNCTAIVELQLAVPICMEAFSDCRALGRFVLRRNGESIAVGRVEETLS